MRRMTCQWFWPIRKRHRTCRRNSRRWLTGGSILLSCKIYCRHFFGFICSARAIKRSRNRNYPGIFFRCHDIEKNSNCLCQWCFFVLQIAFWSEKAWARSWPDARHERCGSTEAKMWSKANLKSTRGLIDTSSFILCRHCCWSSYGKPRSCRGDHLPTWMAKTDQRSTESHNTCLHLKQGSSSRS